MNFYTAFNRPEKQFDKGGGKRITEQAGYIPPKNQIEIMMLAGQRLAMARKEEYDFSADEAVPDDFIDPTREPGIDVVDVQMHLNKVQAKLQEQAEAAAAAKVAEEEKAASEAAKQEQPPA